VAILRETSLNEAGDLAVVLDDQDAHAYPLASILSGVFLSLMLP
jgi:hypothetical protein